MKKKKKYVILTLVSLMGFFLLMNFGTLAKYVSSVVLDYYLKTKSFYFSSTHLGSNTIKNVDNNWDGESVHFDLKNSLNQKVITNYDIDYEVICTIEGEAAANAECRLNGTESNKVEGVLESEQICVNYTGDMVDVTLYNKEDCELGGYNWENQLTTNDLYFDIILTNVNYELKNVKVNIKATSTSPYRKTLNGEFVLNNIVREENKITLDYKNYNNYDRLIISNSYMDNKCVKVNWDSNKLLIDAETNDFNSYQVDLDGYINEISLNVEGKKSISYIFYKKNFNETYDVSEFSFEEITSCDQNN